MVDVKLILASACLIVIIQGISGHGFMKDPAARAYAFKAGFGTPADYDYMGVICGRVGAGGCLPCGNAQNANGAKFGTGKIVKKYKKGQVAAIEVVLTANHLGHFEFSVCKLKGKEPETENCFKKIKLASGGYKYKVGPGSDFKIKVILPKKLRCKHCSFRWHYEAKNTGELYRNCADISIL